MPVGIKIVISLLTVLVVGGFSYMQLGGANHKVAYTGFALLVLMLLAMWIFPETGKVKR
ncbi:hypothetical protein N9L49_03985 [Rhodospirillales bacterium]|nr:hypothetical protein [Rhodospirillales bacterium]